VNSIPPPFIPTSLPPVLPPPPPPRIAYLGLVDYLPALHAMQAHNRAFARRGSSNAEIADEFWLLEHPPVYTLGLAGKPEHVLDAGSIPVIQVERGGQVTYHGPGQLVMYLLLDIKRLGARGNCKGVKELVRRIEQSLIDLLAEYGIEAYRMASMPGVYVRARAARTGQALGHHAKIAALGLRVANHATYHGLALNVDMDLEPFARINPCGYEGLAVAQMRDFGVTDTMDIIGGRLVELLSQQLYGKHYG
jgi:lipoyl(octanoyl) transferase